MAELLVTQDGDVFRISLTDGASTTQHEVRVTSGDLAALGLQECDPRAVVEESFRFLLDREPKESIMASFDLGTITSFFPDYPTEIRRQMSGQLDQPTPADPPS